MTQATPSEAFVEILVAREKGAMAWPPIGSRGIGKP